jgi:aminocarboxymuconate-semialdehyde decarboxylase
MADPAVAPELARVGNDALADWVAKHPTRFCGFIASLPMNQPTAAQDEAHRAVKELGACGVQVYSNVAGAALDRPEYLEIFAALAELECPVWLHPIRPMTFADYADEEVSKYDIWWSLGWPYETSVAMVRLAFSGLFDRHPNLVVITHHLGGVIPLMEGRLGSGMELLGTRHPPQHANAVATDIQEPVLTALRRFYADTASFGSQAAIECGRAFFGVDHLLFGTDMPFDPEEGPGYVRETLAALKAMDLTEEERRQILSGNAERLFGLETVGEP